MLATHGGPIHSAIRNISVKVPITTDALFHSSSRAAAGAQVNGYTSLYQMYFEIRHVSHSSFEATNIYNPIFLNLCIFMFYINNYCIY